MRKLLKKYGFVPDKLVTDELRSYAAAVSLGLGPEMERRRKALLYCLHLRSLRNDAVLCVTPKGDEKLAGQCHDHDLLDSATGFADPFAEPSRQGAVRLPAEPQPGEFHHRRSHASVTVLADPLLALAAAA